MVPGSDPQVTVVRRPSAPPQKEDSDEDSEQYSTSDEEEGEYNTKAHGKLLRHPGSLQADLHSELLVTFEQNLMFIF